MRFMSRALVHEEDQQIISLQGNKIDFEGTPTSLTVWRKSLLLNCSGFTVIDSSGNLVYRVDNYSSGRQEEIVLMDCSGKPIVSMLRRKIKLGLQENWLVYEGEIGDYCNGSSSSKQQQQQQPIWCVKKQVNMKLQSCSKNNVLAHVTGGSLNKKCGYVIEGSYALRSCKILEKYSRRVAAEIRPKESAQKGVSFGGDVFVLSLRPGFDPGFGMAMVMVLDQMFS